MKKLALLVTGTVATLFLLLLWLTRFVYHDRGDSWWDRERPVP